MPKEAKDKEINKNSNIIKSTTTKKSTTEKVSNTNKSATEKKSNKKVADTKKSVVEKKTSKKVTDIEESVAKTKSTKKTVTSKKNTVSKGSPTKTASKNSTTSKTTKKSSRVAKKLVAPAEYYDLISNYNQTTVKILAQTPSCLFVYWEISENDKLKLKEDYGNDFFENSKPYLLIINETMNYSFEIEINDYANSWYIHIHDSDCKYTVKLIRKLINYTSNIVAPFISITSSNEMSAPNDRILFDKLGKIVFFQNVKNNAVISKDISSISFISNIGRIYNIYNIYKEIYKNELNGDELGIGLSSSDFNSTFI